MRETPISPNTVQLMIMMAWAMLYGGGFGSPRRRSGKLLILRLTPRGLRRWQRATTRSCRISSSTLSWKAALWCGGNGDEGRKLAADDADSMKERESIWILIGFERRFMD